MSNWFQVRVKSPAGGGHAREKGEIKDISEDDMRQFEKMVVRSEPDVGYVIV